MNWLECLWPAAAAEPEGEALAIDTTGKPVKKASPADESHRFTYVTNLAPQSDDPRLKEILGNMIDSARLRRKIENEGFNCQKNPGYGLHHKYSRQSLKTLHVYYILLQI